MTRHFIATGYLPEGTLTNRAGEVFDFAELPPFLRVLLSTDGTVTKSLESYFWEQVEVENLGQNYIELTTAAPVIGCESGERVMRRRVQLVGADTRRCYALAESLIRTAILPVRLREDLEAGRVGIGELLRECKLETYREIVDLGYSHGDPAESVWRSYRIVMEHEPFTQITEHFPLNIYA